MERGGEEMGKEGSARERRGEEGSEGTLCVSLNFP